MTGSLYTYVFTRDAFSYSMYGALCPCVMYASVCTYLGMCMGKPEKAIVCFCITLETGSLTEPDDACFSPGGWPVNSGHPPSAPRLRR